MFQFFKVLIRKNSRQIIYINNESSVIETSFSGLMMEDLNLPGLSGWEKCPADVLMIIFKQLDSRSLLSCMEVNEWWKDVVDYVAQHYGLWSDIAQEGMLNKGLTFRRKSSPTAMSWRDLYINSHLWQHVAAANMTWGYFQGVEDIQSLHIYKDYLMVTCGLDGMKCYDINNVSQEIEPATRLKCEEDSLAKSRRDQASDSISNDNHTLVGHDFEGTDRMMAKALCEGPFTKFSVFDDNCFYILDDKNVMRCYKWDGEKKAWANKVLGRYYGCNRSISDIHVYDGDVYMLLKGGLVLRIDREGRNFEKAFAFDFPHHTMTHFVRLVRSTILRTIEKVFVLNIPEYNTGRHVMFNKFSAVVAVPGDKEFKINCHEGADQIVMECPDLTCALEHGDILFLGYKHGRVDICNSKKFLENGGKPEVSVIVQDNQKCLGHDPTIVALEVHEAKNCHHLFVATHSDVYRLVITYPHLVKNSLRIK